MTSVVEVFGSATKSFEKLLIEQLESFKSEIQCGISIHFDSVGSAINSNHFNVLVLMEPPAVMPENYQKNRMRKFDLVIPLSPWRAKYLGYPCWSFQPIELPQKSISSDSNRINGIVMINDHKFGASRHSLYGLRRKIISMLECKEMPLFLYGPNWKMTPIMEIRKRVAALRRIMFTGQSISFSEVFGQTFRSFGSYQGRAVDKMATLRNYKYALVIENDLFSLTEKLFDALYAGCLVFYVGPSLENLKPLNLTFVPLPIDPDLAAKKIEYLMANPPQEVLEEASLFVNNPKSMEYLSEKSVTSSVVRDIVKNAKSSPKNKQRVQ